ncbi:site-specific integrase [Muribaculum intestinale]|uniref:site-specific integrase n=1 Tax=Muribaculum intestinale TaxID=1796646 RepID=UPI0025A9ECE8|nr:site-specific integrase [Muribaculum intestinale]
MKNQQFFNATFIARKARVLRNGEVPIILRISIAGQRAELNINRTVKPDIWVAAKGMSKGKSRADIELNRYLETVRAKLLAIHTQMVAEGALINPDTMKKRFLGFDEKVKIRMFLETFRENNEKYRKRLELGDISEGTVLRWERCVTYLKEYFKSHKKAEDLPLRDVTLPMIDDFELWLRTEKRCGHNCAIRYISTIRSVIRDAVNYKWLDVDPFYGKTYSKKKTNREHLSEAELNAIMSLDLKVLPRLEAVRDLFVFCCFTGLAFSDVSTLTADKIVTDADGELWIRKHREKTDELSSIPLLEIPRQIIEKYSDHKKIIGTDRLLPVLSNQR